jgi:hypothetical protein
MKIVKSSLIVAAILAVALPVIAQRKRVSPHEAVSATIDGSKVTIVYGRPYTKDPKTGEPRKIWGKLVPYGKVWRTGADEATILTTEKDLDIGGTTVPAGKYSLYTLPEESGTSKLIINKQTGQWGTIYKEDQDFARVDLKKETLDKPVDQFTMAIEPGASGGGTLKMMWDTTQYSVPLKAK